MRLQVQSLALLSGLRIHVAVSCGVGCRHNQILCCCGCRVKLAATAPIRPLAWEPPYATGMALEKAKRQKKKKKKSIFPALNYVTKGPGLQMALALQRHPACSRKRVGEGGKAIPPVFLRHFFLLPSDFC